MSEASLSRLERLPGVPPPDCGISSLPWNSRAGVGWGAEAAALGMLELARKGVPRDPAFLMRACFSSATNRCVGRRLL